MSMTHIPVVTPGELKRARGCAKSLQMSGLHLITPESEKNCFYKKVLSLLKTNIKTDDEEIKAYIHSNVKPEWFDVQAAAGVWADLLANKIIRFRNYLMEQGYRIKKTDYPVCVDYASDPKYGNVGTDAFSFGIVKDRCDFILEKENEVRLVKVVSKALSYSYRGQNDETRAIYSPELLAMRASMAEEYPEAYTELWSLTSKEDRAGTLAAYESAPGKNIISVKYNMDAQLAKAELLRCCQIIGKKTSCSNCIHSSYCTEHLAPPSEEELYSSANAPAEQAVRHAEELKASDGAARFTDAQFQVIEHQDGPMSVIAIPGAGKTRVIVERTVHMIMSGIPAEKILIISFTLKACEEIRERLKDRVPVLPVIMTFNALGASILRKYASKKCTTLLTDGRKLSEIKKILDNDGTPIIHGVSYDGAASKYGLINMLSQWFSYIDTNGTENFKKEYADKDVENILDVYSKYTEATRDCITYDEQVSHCNEVFEKHPEYARELSECYRYIMVDEYQDTNEAQAKMLYNIAGYHENLVVVGDDDQAVYRWRGGDKKFLLNFCSDFPNARKVYMSDNFRSSQEVLQAASKCLEDIPDRESKAFIAHHTSSMKPALLRNCSVKDVPKLVQRLLSGGYKEGEIAILGRTNKVLEGVSSMLLENRIKHRPAKQYLIHDTVFLTLYDVLNLKYSGYDEDKSMYRLLRFLGIPDNELQKIWWSKTLYQNFIDSGILSGFDVSEISAHKHDSPLHEALYKIASMVEFSKYTISAEDLCRTVCKRAFGFSNHPAIDSIMEAVCNDNCKSIADMYMTMQNMIIFSDTARVEYGVDITSVNLLTAHDAKGKEFPCVIIVNLEDFSADDESRRLLFVAMSRAKRDLFIFISPLSDAPLAGVFNNTVAVYG